MMMTFDRRIGGTDSTTGAMKFALDDGLPTKTFTADLLKIGTTYRHPKDDWELEVTPELADQIAATSEEMQNDGVAVPILTEHIFDEDPDNDKVMGRFKGAFVEDGWLRAKLQFRGADSIEAAERIGFASVGLLEKLFDGEGHTYRQAIQHVALTPYPVVNQQRDFLAIAASLGTGDDGDDGADDGFNQELHDQMLEMVNGPADDDAKTADKPPPGVVPDMWAMINA